MRKTPFLPGLLLLDLDSTASDVMFVFFFNVFLDFRNERKNILISHRVDLS